MAFLGDRVFDSGLSALDTEADKIHITSSEISAHGSLAAATLGNATVSIGAPTDRSGGGREVTVAQVTGASVTGTGTATHYCIVDSGNSRVLVAGALTASQSVTSGNTFSLASFAVGVPDPA